MPIQNDETIVGLKICLLVWLLDACRVLRMFVNVEFSFLFVLPVFVFVVFFHFIPEDGEVFAVADRCFHALYKILRV